MKQNKDIEVMMKFTRDEIDALLFYQGSIENISKNKSMGMKEFYSIDNAYNVLNVLLFPGIGNEKVRIAEGKELNQELVLHMQELLEIYCNIYSAMCKYTFLYEKNTALSTRRADRAYSVSAYEDGRSFSFLSTSSKEQVDKYFCKKEGLVLLEVESTAQIEHIDLNKVLGDNSNYQGEEEILYAPFLHVNLEKLTLDESEKRLKDCNGNPPFEKYRLVIMNSLIADNGWNSSISEKCTESKLYQEIVNKDILDNVIYVWNALKERQEIEPIKEKMYVEWKTVLQKYLQKRFENIKSDTVNLNKGTLCMLQKDISDYKNWTNQKRMEYSKNLKWCNVALSVMQPLVAVAMALSFIEEIEIIVKIIGIILTGACMITYRLCEVLGLKGKVEQRTLTYLRLDELEREIQYEPLINKEKELEFIGRFKAIIIDDDRRCESNIKKVIRNMDVLSVDNIPKGEIL